jgi:hypothetical protein
VELELGYFPVMVDPEGKVGISRGDECQQSAGTIVYLRAQPCLRAA